MVGVLIFIAFFAFFYLLHRIQKVEKTLHEQGFKFKSSYDYDEQAEKEQAPQPAPLPTSKIKPLSVNELTYPPKESTSEPIEEEKKGILPPLPKAITDKFEKPKERAKLDKGLEFKFGGKIFTGIGAIAIVFAIGFLLRWAFEEGLITDQLMVILGLIVGAVLIILGEVSRKKYPLYGQIITGGGLGVLYLSLFASYTMFELVGYPFAFAGMIAVTAIGVILAIRYDSIALAAFAQIGGFLTPFLLSTPVDHPHARFLYIALLDIGILAIARWKLWRYLIGGSFIGTIIVFAVWMVTFYTKAQHDLAAGYLTLFWAIFLGISLVQYFFKKAPQDEYDLSLLTINAALFYAVLYYLLKPFNPDYMGLYTLILATVYLLFALAIKSEDKIDLRFKEFLAGIGFVLLVIFVPVQFKKFWITVAWAAEGLVLTYLGFRMNSKNLRFFAHGVFLLSLIRLLVIDSFYHDVQQAWFNERMLTFVICLILFSIAATIYRYKKDQIVDEEKSSFSILLLITSLIIVWSGSIEIIDFAAKWWLSVYWSLALIIISSLAFALDNKAVRTFAFIILTATFIRAISVDTDISSTAIAWVNYRVYVFLCMIVASGYLLTLYKLLKPKSADEKLEETNAASSILMLHIYISLLWLVSAEIFDFHSEYWLPICWSIGALGAGAISVATKDIPLRLASYGTFIIAGLRLVGYETKVDLETYKPILNTRVLTFLTTIISAGILSKLINLSKDKITAQEKKYATVGLFFGFNYLLLWLCSYEVMDFFNQKLYLMSQTDKSLNSVKIANLKNSFLSVTWTIYAVVLLIIGIIRRSIIGRALSIFLFGVVILKVFLYDTANLKDLYRFISFITLGIILLLTGFLYHRFRDRIEQFIKAEE